MQKNVQLILCCTMIVLCACASGPYRDVTYQEIRKAESVLIEAQKLEAQVYAPETYFEARLALNKAKELMSTEQYRASKAYAEKAQAIGERSRDESSDERARISMLAERLLGRGDEIWNGYQQVKENQQFAPDALIEIKSMLKAGHEYLDSGNYMEALDAAQQSHLKLASIPQTVEKSKIERLDKEKKRILSEQSAEEIIKAAQQQASEIISQARLKAETLLQGAKVRAARERIEEFERMYPSTYKVKKGETLVDIARRREIFNDQFMWPLIYKANRDQIRDPKVVFPDQVLSVPRDLTFEEIIESRKQAEAPPPFIPPRDAYNPEFYRRYIMIIPETTADGNVHPPEQPEQAD